MPQKVKNKKFIPERPLRKSGIRMETYYKNLDNMKLLASYHEFQKDIKEARKFLEIPDSGFKTDKDVQVWTRETDDKSDEIFASKKFQVQLRMIREKLDKKEIGLRVAEKQSKFLHNEIPWNYLTNTTYFLCQKYNVPENYSDYLRQYIFFNTINAPMYNFGGGEYPAMTSPKQNRFIPFKIYTRLTDSDLRDLKQDVEFYGKHLPRFQAIKDIDKKLRIEEWLKNRKQFDPVENKPYNVSLAYIAEHELGSKKKAKYTFDVGKNLRKIRKRRFGEHI